MCGGGSNSTSTSTTKVDPMTAQAKKFALGRAFDIANQSFPSYDWKSRVAGFNQNQNNAFGGIANWAQQPSDPNYGYAQQTAHDYGAAPAQNISTQRLVDESGQLGKISDYMNPYLSQALSPAIRDIQNNAQVQRNQIGANALQAGAFGDARHGITESENYRNEGQNIGDLSSQAYSNAYNTAMGQRSNDLSRFMSADQFNAQAKEQQLSRMFGAGQQSMAYDTQKSTDDLNRYLSLLGIGDKQQQNTQQLADARYENFLRGVEWPFRGLEALNSVASGAPTSQSVTSQSPQQNPLLQLLGGLGGSLL
jgi:hypothetical protein